MKKPSSPRIPRSLGRKVGAWVVRSNVFPLSLLYRSMYWAAIQVLVYAFKRQLGDHLETIYLRRSLTQKFQVYGLSDIDLCIVLKEGAPQSARESAMRLFSAACARLPLLDTHPEVFTRDEMLSLHQVDLRYYFRFIEGKRSWKTLYGRNIIEDFPESMERNEAASFCESRTYLTLFNGYFFGATASDPFEARMKEYFVFKCLCNSFRAILQRSSGKMIFDRLEIIREFKFDAAPRPGQTGYAQWGRFETFLDYSVRYRFRKLYRDHDPVAYRALLDDLLAFMLASTLEACRLNREGYGSAFGDEYSRYYGRHGRFEVSGREVSHLTQRDVASLGPLANRVAQNFHEGKDSVYCTDGVVINFSNFDLPQASGSVVLQR